MIAVMAALASGPLAPAGASTTITLQQRTGVYEGTEDAWLDESPSYNQDDNFGGDVDLCVRYDGGYSDCALVKFNLSGQIPAHQRILAATLTLYYNDSWGMGGSDDAITIKPFRVNAGKGWYENTGVNLNGEGVNFLYRDRGMSLPWSYSAAWNDATDDGNGTAKIEGSGGQVPGAIRPGNPVSFSVLPSLALWYGTSNNGLENNGFLLVAIANQGGGDNKYGLFDSSEKYSYNWYNNPKLVITFEGALKPVAEASGPYTCPYLGTVQLDGTSSRDPDGGSIQSWLWDLDGDLDYDDATGSTPTLTFEYLRYTLHLPAGDNTIRLKVKDDENEWCIDPDTAVLTVVDPTAAADGSGPGRLAALSVSPNPSSGACRIVCLLPDESAVRIAVFDLSGRLVHAVNADRLPRGEHVFDWDGRGEDNRALPSGIYLTRMRSQAGEVCARMVLLR
jgi:hypothetical protein